MNFAPPTPNADAPAAAPAASGDAYEPAKGFDRETVELKKELEPVVYDKVMSDLTHVVWAYGIIFTLFAAYAAYLWRRSSAIRSDVDALRRELDSDR